ncbi:MAG: hypothetical protein CL916_01780 [Deltaproteobacteria bacterium]|nr:hypothetical protein [Deltaproteobacteria bacterium]
MNTIEKNGTLVGTWTDDFATKFFSDAKNAGITKLIINNGHSFQNFAWLSKLTNLEEITISGTHNTILDLSVLPTIEGRDFSVSISGSFNNITNWYSTSATSLFFGHIELSQLNADDWAPAEKWGQRLKSFETFYSLPIDFCNLDPQQLTSFAVESSALGLESLAGCSLDYFGGDDDSWNSLYMAFKDNTDQCPTAKEVVFNNGSGIGWGHLLKWVAPQKVISFTDTIEDLRKIESDPQKMSSIIAGMPSAPCTFTMHNILDGTFLTPLEFIAAMKEKGHTVVFPDSSALYLDKETHQASSVTPTSELTMTTFADFGMNESDIQKILVNNFPATYTEPLESFDWRENRRLLHNNCILLATEFSPLPADIAGGRIDMLAMDQTGCSVVFELKDKNDSGQLGQALSYVSILSELDGETLFSLLSIDTQQELTEFMEKSGLKKADLNRNQRIVLVAESFDARTQISVDWMNAMHEEDIPFIDCICIVPLKDTQNNMYLHLAPIEPFGLGQKLSARKEDIDRVISYTTNEAARSFIEQYKEGEWNTNFNVRYIRSGNNSSEKRTWKVFVRKNYLSVLQMKHYRFGNDHLFWSTYLSNPDSISETTKGMTFQLVTQEDMELFQNAIRRNPWFSAKLRALTEST